MSDLARLWEWLEARPGRTAVLAEWRRAAGDGFAAVAGLLQPLDRRATAYPNPREHGPPMKVVHHRDGTIVAIDEVDWRNRLDLRPDDVVLHRLDLRRLRTALCGVLGCLTIARTPVDPAARWLQIGNWEPKRAASFPAYLLHGRGTGGLRQLALDRMTRCTREGAILLTFARTNWTDELLALLKGRRMLLVAIGEIVGAAGSGLAEAPAWEEYLRAFCQMVGTTLPSNYRTKAPPRRRAELMAKVERVKKALIDYIRAARDHAFAGIDAGRGAQRLHVLTKSGLAELAGLKPYHITRCFQADPQLARLLAIANDPDELLRYGR